MSDAGELAAVLFYHFVARKFLPASWFRTANPDEVLRASRRGKPSLQIVTHCWRYSHFLNYQLSSLVIHQSKRLDLKVTVFFAEEDEATRDTLDFFGKIDAPSIVWDWQPLPKERLFRRSIGRNLAAKHTLADWVWFTDADVVFGERCLDTLADTLLGRDDLLVFPAVTRATGLLLDSDPVLQRGRMGPALMDLSPRTFPFRLGPWKKAMGPYQIVHGDLARTLGYCASIRVYQKSTRHWRKCYEDSAFRWLLGTNGVPIELEGVFQIRHLSKGRYRRGTLSAAFRSFLRKRRDPHR